MNKYFSKLTVIGRTVRTFLQAVIGICIFISGLFLVPGLSDFLVHNQFASVTTLSLIIAVTSYVHNAAEQALNFVSNN